MSVNTNASGSSAAAGPARTGTVAWLTTRG